MKKSKRFIICMLSVVMMFGTVLNISATSYGEDTLYGTTMCPNCKTRTVAATCHDSGNVNNNYSGSCSVSSHGGNCKVTVYCADTYYDCSECSYSVKGGVHSCFEAHVHNGTNSGLIVCPYRS